MSADFIYSELSKLDHNPHYLKRYLRLIARFSGSGNVMHHILPKSMFPLYSSLKINEWNCAKLTPRQHYVIHWILWKAFPNNTSMFKAFYAMTNKDKQKIDSRTYENLRLAHCVWNRKTKTGNKNMSLAMSENRKNGTIPTWNKGVSGYSLNTSDEARARQVEAGKKKPSTKTKKLMSKSMGSKPRVCCVKCKLEVAEHHLNRHLNGTKCLVSS